MPDLTRYIDLNKKFKEEQEHLEYWQNLLAQRKKIDNLCEFYVANIGTTPIRRVYRQRDFISVEACLVYDGQWLKCVHFKPGSEEDPAMWCEPKRDHWRKVTRDEAVKLFPAAFIEDLMVEVLSSRLKNMTNTSVCHVAEQQHIEDKTPEDSGIWSKSLIEEDKADKADKTDKTIDILWIIGNCFEYGFIIICMITIIINSVVR